MIDLRFQEVTTPNQPDFVRLFESRGSPKYCWCMVWRDRPVEIPGKTRSAKKAAMEAIIKSGTRVGILGYLDDDPVAWCSIAPRPTYRKGLGGVEIDDESLEKVWALACFFIPLRFRGTGMGRQLLVAAVEHTRVNGATSVEAYPVDLDSPSYLFMGFVPMFEQAGFREVGRVGTRRHVMRLDLLPASAG